MKTLKEQIDELIEQIDDDDDKLIETNETATQIEDLQNRIEDLESSVKALTKVNDSFELWHRMNGAAIDLIVETIDGKGE